jgi:hypothetical protein
MKQEPVLYSYTVPNPFHADVFGVPMRYFAVEGQVWGRADSGEIVDVYGIPAPDGDVPGLRARIEGFLSVRR